MILYDILDNKDYNNEGMVNLNVVEKLIDLFPEEYDEQIESIKNYIHLPISIEDTNYDECIKRLNELEKIKNSRKNHIKEIKNSIDFVFLATMTTSIATSFSCSTITLFNFILGYIFVGICLIYVIYKSKILKKITKVLKKKSLKNNNFS